MSDEFAANFPLLVSSGEARDGIARALRLFVGRGRRYSVKQLSNSTGVREWEINQALIPADDPKHRPLKPECLMSISMFLGAAFINEWISPTNVGVFDLPEEGVCPGEFAADNTDDNASIVRDAIDKVWGTRTGIPDLMQIGNRMMQRGAQLIAIGRAKPDIQHNSETGSGGAGVEPSEGG